eukprot:366643_1
MKIGDYFTNTTLPLTDSSFEGLRNALKEYNNIDSINTLDQFEILPILNDFLYLIHHNADFEKFASLFTDSSCNVFTCDKLQRMYRDRDCPKNTAELYDTISNETLTKQHILDKIHCYLHSADIGYRVRPHNQANIASNIASNEPNTYPKDDVKSKLLHGNTEMLLKDYEWLQPKHAKLLDERERIVKWRSSEKMEEYRGTIKVMPEDKYSLVNCYLYHIYKQIQQDGKTDEFKKKFIKFIVEHENDYKHFMQPHKTIDNYIHNLSSKLHLQALHEMAKINILVFEYNGQNDQLSENYYRNPLFQTDTCLFLMYYDHSKHYDYCNMEKTEGYQLPDKKGKKCKKGTKYFELASFDSKILKRTDNIPDVSARNSRYTQLNSSCLQHNNIYSFGKNLWYGDEDEYNTPNSIVVSPKYNCLKQELISNQIAVL